MNQKHKLTRIVGWILLAAAALLFCMQLGYFYVHAQYQAEYVDDRVFYSVNMLCIICLISAMCLLLKATKKWIWIGAGLTAIFIIANSVLMVNSNEHIKHYTSISPDFKHVFSVKEDQESGEAVYFRSRFGILARPKEKLPYKIKDTLPVEWLASDVAAFTYSATDDSIHQFIGTYGSRGNGLSYNYVASEIRGEWEGENTQVISDMDGISVTENGETGHFDADHIVQFGTLAVVLMDGPEAAWTISLDENFQSHANEAKQPSGNITLYKASREQNAPITQHYVGEKD